MIDYRIISSSSEGNAVIFENSVLVDIGVSFKRIKPYLDGLKLVLITHEHADHFKLSTARMMAIEKPLLRFACGSWMVKSLIDAGVGKNQIYILNENMRYDFGVCKVVPVGVYHDVKTYAYKIHFLSGKVFYATDCGNLNGVVATGYDLYAVEANYDDAELRARMDAKLAEGQYAYEQRVLKFHLSKKQCDEWLSKNMGEESKFVYLHQHVVKNES